jgi:sugar phosphate isomerase/epimerase
MRLGGPVFRKFTTADEWLEDAAYRAVYCPDIGLKQARELERAAAKRDVVIAEVGAWSNPLAADPVESAAALRKNIDALALAEAVGARCCVNISGSRGAKWDGPDARNLTRETFDLVVENTRRIIDAVKPRRTFYTLECMPWMVPDSAESYLALIEAIDRPAFGVHFDPVNLISSPQLYFGNGAFIRDFVARLGPYIRSVHAKDILLCENLTVHLDEVRPGLGGLDYQALFRALAALDPDLPVMLEHLPSEEEYRLAARHVRNVAAGEKLAV